jgi:hypothetical protein
VFAVFRGRFRQSLGYRGPHLERESFSGAGRRRPAAGILPGENINSKINLIFEIAAGVLVVELDIVERASDSTIGRV